MDTMGSSHDRNKNLPALGYFDNPLDRTRSQIIHYFYFMPVHRLQFTLFACLLILLASCHNGLPVQIEDELAQLPETVDFNFHVKPILSDRCFACHGPDAQKREADLRLDIADHAYAMLESGKKAIVPGNLTQSELVQRLLSSDPEYQMPPSESNLVLTAREKATLIKWVQQGAEFKPHWAFSRPGQIEIPSDDSGWARNEIDHFILAKLKENDIHPSPVAEREQLIRRLYFDLTGLPPSLSDLDEWLGKEDFYSDLVEHLLQNPAYGERLAAHWLDVARFADSEGYLDDFHHTFWPYRDWVIKAFNENLPYDEFILWQLGGDQMPKATTEQKLATAFNRHHKQNSEGGVIPEEFRVDYVADRTNTVGAAFMALTIGCARCHDHKYDPLSQENYYELFGFFNSTIERGDGIFSLNAIEKGDRIPNKYSMNAGPVLALPSAEVEEIRDYLLQEIETKEREIKDHAAKNESAFKKWLSMTTTSQPMKSAIKESTVSHLTFDDMANGTTSDLTPGSKAAKYSGSIAAVPGYRGKAVQSNAHGQLVAEGKKSAFERNQPFTISFWIQTPKLFEEAHVLYNGNDRIQGYRGWDIMLDSNRVHFRLNHAHPYQSIDIFDAAELPVNEWVHYVWTYDGSSDADGMQVYRNGQNITFSIHRNYLYRSTKPYFYDPATVYKPYKGLIIGNRHYDQDFTGGLIDEVQILNKEADQLVATYLFNPAQGEQAFLAALSAPTDADDFFDQFIDRDLDRMRRNMRMLQSREIETIDTVQEIMVMGDQATERPTYVLDRGVYSAHGKRVQRNVPAAILPWPNELPKNRLGLGKWLIHEDHPLTARVAVNQIWYLIFGRGIVETVEDFGNQGALPTHPELLDWLANDFRQNGWNVKRLIRQMVQSATYRQSSKIRMDLADIDPDNRLLARSPRYRRSAEMVRDNILAASGLLDHQLGGPSTFPYQPDGLWKEVMTHSFFPEYEIDYDRGLYRRSIYTFWKRNMPPPSMLIFDASSRAECQVRRQRSNTPLQALVLLNDPQMIEGCRVLSENIWRQTQGNVRRATTHAFRLLTSRSPTQKESKLLYEQYHQELQYFQNDLQATLDYLAMGNQPFDRDLPPKQVAALARVTNTILNSTEAYYKN